MNQKKTVKGNFLPYNFIEKLTYMMKHSMLLTIYISYVEYNALWMKYIYVIYEKVYFLFKKTEDQKRKFN